jgi:hypothetical protein
MKGSMTDITKYRNVSLTHDTYKTLISVESLANEKAKKLNGKAKKI